MISGKWPESSDVTLVEHLPLSERVIEREREREVSQWVLGHELVTVKAKERL